MPGNLWTPAGNESVTTLPGLARRNPTPPTGPRSERTRAMFRQRRTNRTPNRRGLRWPLRLLRLEDRTAPATLLGFSIVNTPLSTTNNLFYFNSANPGTLATFPWGQAVTGLGTREELRAIDFRPATGQLYGVA